MGEHEQEQRGNHRGETVRRALLSKAPLVDIPETAVANRDRNLKEEVVRTKKRIDLLEMKKQLSLLERQQFLVRDGGGGGGGGVPTFEISGEVANRDKSIIEEMKRTKKTHRIVRNEE